MALSVAPDCLGLVVANDGRLTFRDGRTKRFCPLRRWFPKALSSASTLLKYNGVLKLCAQNDRHGQCWGFGGRVTRLIGEGVSEGREGGGWLLGTGMDRFRIIPDSSFMGGLGRAALGILTRCDCCFTRVSRRLLLDDGVDEHSLLWVSASQVPHHTISYRSSDLAHGAQKREVNQSGLLGQAIHKYKRPISTCMHLVILQSHTVVLTL